MNRARPIDLRHSGPPPWICTALQTRLAQALVRGRARQDSGKAGIPGLEAFARAAARVHNAAAEGDPRAAQALIRIDAALADAHTAVRAEIGLMADLLTAATGNWAAPAKTARPPRVPPAPANPYAHRGACLLADLDRLVRAIWDARQCDAIDRRRAYALLSEAGRPVRLAFACPATVWRRADRVRADIRNNTPAARHAKARHTRPAQIGRAHV